MQECAIRIFIFQIGATTWIGQNFYAIYNGQSSFSQWKSHGYNGQSSFSVEKSWLTTLIIKSGTIPLSDCPVVTVHQRGHNDHTVQLLETEMGTYCILGWHLIRARTLMLGWLS